MIRRRAAQTMAALAVSVGALTCCARAQRIPGPFIADSLAFYIVHDGGPLTVALHINRPVPELADQVGDVCLVAACEEPAPSPAPAPVDGRRAQLLECGLRRHVGGG